LDRLASGAKYRMTRHSEHCSQISIRFPLFAADLTQFTSPVMILARVFVAVSSIQRWTRHDWEMETDDGNFTISKPVPDPMEESHKIRRLRMISYPSILDRVDRSGEEGRQHIPISSCTFSIRCRSRALLCPCYLAQQSCSSTSLVLRCTTSFQV